MLPEVLPRLPRRTTRPAPSFGELARDDNRTLGTLGTLCARGLRELLENGVVVRAKKR